MARCRRQQVVDVTPSPGPEGPEGLDVGTADQGDTESGSVVLEQAFLQATGEVPVLVLVPYPYLGPDNDPGDREKPPGRGRSGQVPREVSVEALPPGPFAAQRETVRATGQDLGFRDQQGESRPPDIGGQPPMEAVTSLLRHPWLEYGGFHVQISEILPTVVDLTPIQRADVFRFPGGGAALVPR